MKKEEKQTIFFKNRPYIIGHYSIVGPKEGKGNLGEYFSEVSNDDFLVKRHMKRQKELCLKEL